MKRLPIVTVLALLTFTTPSLAQGAATVETAIEKLRQICQATKSYAVDLGATGEFAFKDVTGKAVALFKLTFSEIFGLADKLPPEQVAGELKEVRQCMRDGLDQMVAKLSDPREGPAIVLMDSLLVPYRKEMTSDGQTNGDDITTALRLLAGDAEGSRKPVRIIKETTGLKWDRQKEVLDLKPSLVIVHFSAFESSTVKCEPSPRGKPNECFETFFAFSRRVIEAGIPMIIYSRIADLCRTHRNAFLSQIGREALQARKLKVHLLQMGSPNRLHFKQVGPKEDVFVLARSIVDSKHVLPPGQHCSLL